MKRLICALIAVILWAGVAYGAGSATITPYSYSVMGQSSKKVLSIAIVAGTDGAFTSSTINATTYGITGWYIYSVETIPGTEVPPGAAYTVTLLDANSLDLAGGLLASRSVDTKQLVNIGTAAHGYPVVRGNLSLAITGLTTTAATTTIIITFVAN